MPIHRRDALSMALVAGAAALGAPPIRPAFAQARRTLQIQLLGGGAAVAVPGTAGIVDILPTFPGYAPPEIARINQIRVVTQTMVAGSSDIGEADPPTVFAAVEAGAKLKIIGKSYDNTSLCLIANADVVKTIADLARPRTRVAIGARGEISHIMLVEPLMRRGIDFDGMTIVEMPGSTTRVSAMISKRVDVASLHFHQLGEIAQHGNFHIILEPWKEIRGWVNDALLVRSDWLQKPENERAAVDVLKAILIAYRKANSDLTWYTQTYRKLTANRDAQEMTEEKMRPIWERIRSEIRAWPEDMNVSIEALQNLLPAYKAAGAIAGTVKVEEVVETKYIRQAVAELGAG